MEDETKFQTISFDVKCTKDTYNEIADKIDNILRRSDVDVVSPINTRNVTELY